MSVLALIPARAGSVRFSGKNMAMLAGRPLVAWTLKTATQARAMGFVYDVAVTSDWTELLNYVTTSWPHVRVIRRPKHLASEIATSMVVQNHALQVYRDEGYRPDVVMLLQPTSPLRTVHDVRDALDVMQKRGADAVVSVTDTDESAYELGHADRLRPVTALMSRHAFVVPNGAIFAIRTDAIDRGEDWWTALTYAYRMPKERSVDIDTVEDLRVAEALMKVPA